VLKLMNSLSWMKTLKLEGVTVCN